MPEIYEHFHTIQEDEIDVLGHANNVAYIEWMQSAALAHTAAQGWPGEAYQQLGAGWVVRAHAIEYLQSALANEQIVIRTLVSTLRNATSVRCYHIVRCQDEQLLATAETKWAFIDYATGRPKRIPRQVADAFQLSAGL